MKRRLLLFTLLFAGVLAATLLLRAAQSQGEEADRLSELLALRQGMAVAEIGAGTGWLTVEVARRVGPEGRVYATELSPSRLEQIRETARREGLDNVTVLEAGERVTNLPAGCCDVVFMRRVYHHLGDPGSILASIRQALRPGGRLAIIEFGPHGVMGRMTRMGLERSALIEQVTGHGFRLVTAEEWPGSDHYIAVFEPSTSP